MTATRMGGSPTRVGPRPKPGTLADLLNRRRAELGLSITEVARRATMPTTTTQRRFLDATDATYGELVRIADVLGLRLSAVIAEQEKDSEQDEQKPATRAAS